MFDGAMKEAMSDDRSTGQDDGPAHREPPSERWIDRLLAGIGLRNAPSIREGLADALDATGPGGDFNAQERSLLKNVLDLREMRVDDAMVPRSEIVAIHADASLAEVLNLFRTAGHSRIPVYGETLDDPRGMVHIRDFVDYLASRTEAQAPGRAKIAMARLAIDLSAPLASAKILRPVLFVPPSMPAMDLLVKMQATRTHMALVIDEYGGTDGLVSMEDLVEMIVGDISDEHDEDDDLQIEAMEGDTFIVDARAGLEEVSSAIGIDLEAADTAEDVDTIGGLIVTLAGRVPTQGETIDGPEELAFEVLDADPRRVKRVRIYRRALAGAVAPPAEPASSAEGSLAETAKPPRSDTAA
ncbi:Magnesium and cobalt efflux protein CorC [Chelatococcus asaccharovorans]|uniref:CBS domain protein n=2 Tax=Chelatococcus asaccharovorans TaxID=28210 RepID=A0A2V3U6W2_9HYPH|nr:CBS domain protein [Chelatococcus asaccharovorans]CAH1658532.1 Magnesium and cobalt efflux protein CorC [Chelatococcus asaccharovorans]CAH1684479.1 Magnesium and cobalt efflux protein CorC [Chelatococcus asaccharovorans]